MKFPLLHPDTFNTSDGTTFSMRGILIGLQLSYVADEILTSEHGFSQSIHTTSFSEVSEYAHV